MEYAVGVLDASAGHPQQEQLKKRGLGNVTPGYTSTVGAGEGFGLGMGVGISVGEVQHPSTMMSQQQWRAEVMQHERGHLSPVTGDGDSGDDLDDEGAETDGSSTSTRRTRDQTSSQSPSMKAFQGFPFHHIDNPFPHDDPMATNASTPTSTTSSAMDFFMMHNNIPRNHAVSAVGVGGGELDFLATTAGWHSSRRDRDD